MLTLEKIKQKLEDKNLSVVARRIGLTPAYLSAICRGTAKNPSYAVIKKISEYLDGENDNSN